MHEITTKERSHFPPNGTIVLGTNHLEYKGVNYPSPDTKVPYSATQYRGYSETCTGMTHEGPPYWHGGGVTIRKVSDGSLVIQGVGRHTNQKEPGIVRVYNGGFICNPYLRTLAGSAGVVLDAKQHLDQQFYSSYNSGAVGWNKFAPGNATADAGIFLAEIADLPRSLATTAKGFANVWRRLGGSKTSFSPKKAADHFLTHQFGWVPFLSDVRKFHRAYKTNLSRMERIKKRNGQWIKRGGSVNQSSVSVQVGGSDTVTAHWPTLTSDCYTDPLVSGSHKITLTKTNNEWFSGSFRYYIPNIDTPEWSSKVQRQLYGLSLSPSVLWEATPWSWLADWCSNMGDVVANMNTGWAENLVAKGAYVMGTEEWTWNIDSSHALKSGHQNATWIHSLTVKDRHRAHPFGFGLEGMEFSPYQIGILTALGVSKLVGF